MLAALSLVGSFLRKDLSVVAMSNCSVGFFMGGDGDVKALRFRVDLLIVLVVVLIIVVVVLNLFF